MRLFPFFVLGTLAIVPSAGAASFEMARDSTLPIELVTRPIGPFRSAPYAVPRDRVWRQVIRHPTPTQSVRIEIRVSRADIAVPWRVIVRDMERTERDRIDGKPGKTGTYWTSEIPGQSAVVEIWTDGPPDGLEIEIGHYAYAVLRGIPQSIHGLDQRVAITDVPAPVRSWGAAVARLRFMTTREDGSLVGSSCTGFLLGGDLLITNHHCIRGDLEKQSAVVDLGYDSYGAGVEKFRITSLAIPPAPELDYSIVHLDRTPPARFQPAVAAGNSPSSLHFRKPDVTGTGFRLVKTSKSRPLVVIQHPSGKPKQVSRKECQVDGILVQAVAQVHATDFGHTCDTLGGSSGSPVIDAETGEILGLHHLGSGQDGTNAINQAVYFSIILNDLATRNLDLYRTITEAP